MGITHRFTLQYLLKQNLFAMQNTNPFELIDSRLLAIEALLLEIKNKALDFKRIENKFSNYPEMLTRRQASELLSISLGTLDTWSKEGRIEKVRNGGIVRYRKSELLANFKSLKESRYSRNEKGGAKW